MTEGLAIGEREVVEEIASRIGLDHAEVEYVLQSDELADFVRHDEKIAHEQLNISGVPFCVRSKFALSGAQPREVFLQVLNQSLAQIEQQSPTDANTCSDENVIKITNQVCGVAHFTIIEQLLSKTAMQRCKNMTIHGRTFFLRYNS